MADEKKFIAEASPGGEASVSPPLYPAEDPPAINAGNEPDWQSELLELKKAFSEFTRQNMPEIDRVRQELSEITAERNNTASELQKLRRENTLHALAEKHGFTEVEYLDFVLQKNRIDLADPEKTSSFMQQLKQQYPRYFIMPLKPGSGSRPGENSNPAAAVSGSRMDILESMLGSAPEIY